MAMLRSFLLLFIIFSMGNAGKLCPCGWTNSGLQCYKFFPQTLDWVAAQRNCQSFGASLASVHSKEQQNFLLGLMPSPSTPAWIGAHDGEIEGQWVWADGTGYDYTNWCATEPNNLNRVENCLAISMTNKYCWNDAPCAGSMGSICVTDL